jgi:hypothetical protein
LYITAVEAKAAVLKVVAVVTVETGHHLVVWAGKEHRAIELVHIT